MGEGLRVWGRGCGGGAAAAGEGLRVWVWVWVCGDRLRVSSERLSHPQPQCLCCKQELGCQRSVDPWEQVPGYVLTVTRKWACPACGAWGEGHPPGSSPALGPESVPFQWLDLLCWEGSTQGSTPEGPQRPLTRPGLSSLVGEALGFRLGHMEWGFG